MWLRVRFGWDLFVKELFFEFSLGLFGSGFCESLFVEVCLTGVYFAVLFMEVCFAKDCLYKFV